MVLTIQINSLIFSFVYGVIFYVLLEINYKFLYNEKLLIKVIYTLFFLLFNTILYFIGLIKINNGAVHVYFILSILVGFVLACILHKKVFKKH